MIAARALARLVRRYFYLSCLEAKRRTYAFVRRYAWQHPGRTLYVWVPFQIPSHRCKEWLEANIPDVEPDRCGEPDRVQDLVNRRVARTEIFSLSEVDKITESLMQCTCSVSSVLENEINEKGLPETVACEKAENIAQQRPTIRMMGEGKLKELICRIFDCLIHGEYMEKELAVDFGLSQATMSRFAGRRWNYHCDETQGAFVPDLWRNTAQTLARHSDFVAAAPRAGVWKRVQVGLDAECTKRRMCDG